MKDLSKLSEKAYREYLKEVKESLPKPEKKYKSRFKNPLPQALLDKYPNLNERQIRMIKNEVLKARIMKLGRILDFTVPNLGRFKTHGNRQRSCTVKLRENDRNRKRELTRIKHQSKEYLLW